MEDVFVVGGYLTKSFSGLDQNVSQQSTRRFEIGGIRGSRGP